MPNTKPSQAPAQAPYSAAPTTIGISTSEMEKGPKRTKAPRSWSMTTTAVSRAIPVSVRVSILFFSIFSSFLLSLRSGRMRRK